MSETKEEEQKPVTQESTSASAFAFISADQSAASKSGFGFIGKY